MPSRPSYRRVLVAVLAILPCRGSLPASAGEPEVLWQVGKLDDSPAELALGEKEEYARFPELFGEDVRFDVGKSSAATALDYIHPGPKDVWAGARSHSVTLSFELPVGPFALETVRLRVGRTPR